MTSDVPSDSKDKAGISTCCILPVPNSSQLAFSLLNTYNSCVHIYYKGFFVALVALDMTSLPCLDTLAIASHVAAGYNGLPALVR